MIRLRPATIAVCLLPLALVACDNPPSTAGDPRTQPPLVRVASVQDATASSRTFTGVVAARVQSDLGFRVSGKVLERLVDAGQSVSQGQPLMRLDPVDLGLQVRAQQEAVAAARARAVQATGDERRYRGLVATGAVSASAYSQIKATAEAAKAQLNAAQAQADVSRNASTYAVLRADADGVVMETLAEPGQVVSAGQAVVRLARAGQREAVVQLPETLRPAINSVAWASLYGTKADPVAATLRVLSDSADSVTRTFEARYVLKDALARAPLGATVSLRLPETASAQPGVEVPIAAVYDAGQGPGVWVVKGKPTTVTWRAVQVLSLSDDAARLTGGLERGEQVVALGAHLLHNGQKVRLAAQTTGGGQP